MSTIAQNMADTAHAKILELVDDPSSGLKTTNHIYKENLGDPKKESFGVYSITLNEKAVWLEEGSKDPYDLKPGLLAGKSGKTSKDGHRYAIVPFSHNTKPSQTTPKAQALINQVKKVLKQENIPFSKIEKHENGSPRLGLLHKIDIDSDKPTAKASAGALQGLRIYQNKDAKGKVSRGIFTFRTVTDGPASEGKWIHPPTVAHLFMDKAFDFTVEQFDREIMPELLKKWSK
jgi:hypothetical protein